MEPRSERSAFRRDWEGTRRAPGTLGLAAEGLSLLSRG